MIQITFINMGGEEGATSLDSEEVRSTDWVIGLGEARGGT